MMKSSDDPTDVRTGSITLNPVKSYQRKSLVTNSEAEKHIDLFKMAGDKAASENVCKDKEESIVRSYESFVLRCLQSFGSGREFVCGWGAALVNITITFPINKIIFRQMLHNVRVGGAYDQIKAEGLLFLYRGVLPPLMQKSISTSLMFGMYENCRQPLVACNIPPLIGNSTAAMLAGTFEAFLTPFERVQTLLQDQYYHKQFRNSTHALRVILAEYGLKEMFRGFVPIVLRNGPSNVCFFALRDYCNEKLPESQLLYLKMAKQFMIGACIGTMISSVFYPFNVLKVHVQSRVGGPYMSVTDTFREVYVERNRSIRGLYRGVYMNCTRAFISWGVINVSYDAIKKFFYNES